jgi:hypothetical protein
MMLPILTRSKKSKRKKFKRENIKAFLNYGEFTEMIAVVDGENKWFCVKRKYSEMKELLEDEFEKGKIYD